MKRKQKNTDAIRKVLSANDTGETGGHQAGMLIPKTPDILSFFPDLGSDQKNPRVILEFLDDSEQMWQFAFIYYNNFYFGGTRNEYRLTHMTNYINANRLKSGDTIVLSRDLNENLHISARRAAPSELKNNVLRLGTTWKVHNFV